MLRRIKNLVRRSIEGRLNTTETDHEKAFAWFENRSENYDRLINSVVSYLNPAEPIFDVGANIGYFSLRLMERLNFRGNCYLFEPVPHLAQLCRETFASTSFNVNVFNYGLSDEDKTVDVFISQSGNIGWNTIIAEKSSAAMKALPIQVRRFDKTGIDARPQFIKIDVEGAEYLVLRGMLSTLAQWNPLPVILCEIGWGNQHPNWKDELAVFGELEGLGYRIRSLGGEAMDVKGLRQTTDVLFLPPPR